jgi:hypothetical protein
MMKEAFTDGLGREVAGGVAEMAIEDGEKACKVDC